MSSMPDSIPVLPMTEARRHFANYGNSLLHRRRPGSSATSTVATKRSSVARVSFASAPWSGQPRRARKCSAGTASRGKSTRSVSGRAIVNAVIDRVLRRLLEPCYSGSPLRSTMARRDSPGSPSEPNQVCMMDPISPLRYSPASTRSTRRRKSASRRIISP